MLIMTMYLKLKLTSDFPIFFSQKPAVLGHCWYTGDSVKCFPVQCSKHSNDFLPLSSIANTL